MTTAEGWAATVRSRIGLGRLLPLGGPADGAWVAERAANAVLRRAARQVPGVEPGRLRIAPAEAEAARFAAEPVFPAPPGSVPPGPLRIEAEFAAGYGAALPDLAERVRTALFAASAQRLGLPVTEVDLRVTALLDAPPDAPATAPPPGEPATQVAQPPEDPVGAAAAAVPGVARLTTTLGPSVHRAADHVRIELETAPGHRALDVAVAVREAVGGTLPVTVLVTDVL
ncbi:hypothetical protein QWM81_27880 [Streptomyces ficellus]|uniref:Nucleopolyhedrovirus P10 family protein n=1 Tax=Streptomyces ficellus TaxID=1977088 RepID=A0ABT7ZEC9_9ACTN|nr:hypothetical protein [Streptomyces ficellus]MDN3297790.1 hypothetical protein [Streptomyces ficellus]